MKKKTLVLFFALVIIGIVISVFSLIIYRNNYSHYNSADISFDNGNNITVTEGEEAFIVLHDSLIHAKKTNEDVKNSNLYSQIKVSFFSDQKEGKTFYLFINSIFKRTAYLSEENGKNIYKLQAEDFNSLFSVSPYNQILTNKTPPTARLMAEVPGKSIKMAVKGYAYEDTWNYATSSGAQETLVIDRNSSSVYSLLNDLDSDFSLIIDGSDYTVEEIVIYDIAGNIVNDDIDTDGLIPNVVKSGDYIYEITVSWPVSPDVDYNGRVKYRFNLSFNFPPKPVLSENLVLQGGVSLLTVYNCSQENTVRAYCEDLNWTGQLFLYNDNLSTFIPFPMDTNPGEYVIIVEIDGQKYENPINVIVGNFKSQMSGIDTSVSKKDSQTLDNKLQPFREYVSSENYISQGFILPAEGNITTEFGTYIYSNDSSSISRHNGIDIKNEKGTPVKATMNGIVLLSENLPLAGNTIVIDHGMNVLSYYYHLDSLNVKQGDVVSTGDIIGTMGSTGRATGSHIHFSLTVNGYNVYPYSLFD